MPFLTEAIGFTAAAVGTSLMIPQIIKSIRTKRADDLSWGMLILYLVNCILWFVYGILIQAYPVILCNFLALMIGLLLSLLKSNYSAKRA